MLPIKNDNSHIIPFDTSNCSLKKKYCGDNDQASRTGHVYGHSLQIKIENDEANVFGRKVSHPEHIKPFLFSFQPYVISTKAVQERFINIESLEQKNIKKTQKDIKKLAKMNENEAKQHFESLMRFEIDRKGFTNDTNYRVVANTSIKKDTILGIYSSQSIAYFSVDFFEEKELTPSKRRALAHKIISDELYFTENIKDSINSDPKSERSLSCYQVQLSSNDPNVGISASTKDNTLTPMHFINSAERYIDHNVHLSSISFQYKQQNVVACFYITTKPIKAGEEILGEYFLQQKNIGEIPSLCSEKKASLCRSNKEVLTNHISAIRVRQPYIQKIDSTLPKHSTKDAYSIEQLGLYDFTSDIRSGN